MPMVADQTTGQQYQIDKTHRGLEATVDETTKILLIIQDREPAMVYASALDLKADRWSSAAAAAARPKSCAPPPAPCTTMPWPPSSSPASHSSTWPELPQPGESGAREKAPCTRPQRLR